MHTIIVKGKKLWKLTFLFVVISLQLDGQVIALLVQNLERLDENVKEDSDGVHNTLGIFYNKMSLLLSGVANNIIEISAKVFASSCP